jgi:hypothetical protein
LAEVNRRALLLLHASSRSNTAALAGILHTLKLRGYGLATVDALPRQLDHAGPRP